MANPVTFVRDVIRAARTDYVRSKALINEQKSVPYAFIQGTSYQDQGPLRTGRNYVSAVREGYKRNEVIHACIAKEALELSGVKPRTEREGTEKELKNHPLTQLLEQPNPYWSWADLITAISVVQKTAGIFYAQKIRSRADGVVQLWPLRPDWMLPVVGSKGLQGYTYEPPGRAAIPMQARDVLALPLFDPMDMYGGLAPVSILGYSGDTDNAMSSFMRNFFLNGGMPMVVLTTDQPLIEEDIQTVRSNWRHRYGGHEKWQEPAVLGQGVSASKLNLSFQDMGFDELDARNEARICMVLGVPPIIIGAKIGLDRSTFANYQEARKSWWEDSLHPKLRHLRGQLARDLIPEFGTGIELEWDLSEIPAFQDDQNELWTRALAHLEGGGILVDEYRKEIGYDPLPNGAGQIFLRSLRVVEVPLGQLGEPEKSTVSTQSPNPADPQQPASEIVPSDKPAQDTQKTLLWPYEEDASFVTPNGTH